jgi:hypothetical protein
LKGRKVKQAFSRMGGGHKERMNEGKYGGYILYLYMKIE